MASADMKCDIFDFTLTHGHRRNGGRAFADQVVNLGLEFRKLLLERGQAFKFVCRDHRNFIDVDHHRLRFNPKNMRTSR